jgi:hypothetical protein
MNMANQDALAHSQSCSAPSIKKLITAYCFGHLNEEDRRIVEAHLLECGSCWQEIQRLDAAIHALDFERSLMQSLSPTDVVASLGISSTLDLLFGGHLWHVLFSSFLYAGLYAVTLLMEVAYQFDSYGSKALKLSPFIFGWIFVTSISGLALDWKRASQGKSNGLYFCLLFFLLAAGVAFASVCLILPTTSITELSHQAYTAQGAYLKDICYSLLLAMIFLIPTFHFVVIMQRELNAGRHKLTLELLTGDKAGVTPRGAIYPKSWMLGMILMVMAAISVYLTANLLDHISPGPHKNLFTNLVYLRLVLYYGLGVKCLVWYYGTLNELKRESRAVTHIRLN